MARASTTPSKAGPKKIHARLNSDTWLDRSLKLLSKRGPGALTLDSLTKHLKVTTGSFYWHFKNHAQFLDQLTDKYIEDYTAVVAKHLASLDLGPREKLIEASRLIISQELSALDVHFRALAITYPRLQPKIEAMDKFRTDVIQGIFEDMGYRGDELLVRVHTFVVLHSMESPVSTCLPPEDRLRLLERRIALLAD